MKLSFDFSELKIIAEKIGADASDFQLDDVIKPFEPIEIELATTGIEVDLDEVELIDGVFAYKGYHVVLYIADHSFNIEEAIEYRSKRRKFHITDCCTLQEKKRDNTYDRYVATRKLDGLFKIHGSDKKEGQEVELDVCMNCLKQTNYKDASDSQRKRKQVKQEFNMQEFFAKYQSSFAKMPSGMGADPNKTNYTKDWDHVSKQYRKSINYRCEVCRLDLSNSHKLLQVHHKDSLKGNNNINNLQALCMLCHAKKHGHMHVLPKDKNKIEILRKQQGL
jgi:hypothetical protein